MKMRLLAAVAALVFSSLVAPAADQSTRPGDGMDLSTLAGEHVVKGRNADGTAYEGTVRIRVKGALILVEWTIGDQVTYGTGLVEGMCLGVALENGVAIYQIVPQAEGKTLMGLWALAGAEKANEESIYIGDTDVDNAKFEVVPIDGAYRAEGKGGESTVTISGDAVVKKLTLKSGGRSAEAEGLALGEGLAVITPDGLTVFQVEEGKKGATLTGHSLDQSGQVTEVTLQPIKE